jgi:hypothetical protein
MILFSFLVGMPPFTALGYRPNYQLQVPTQVQVPTQFQVPTQVQVSTQFQVPTQVQVPTQPNGKNNT